MAATKKVKVKKLSFKRLFILLLILYFIGYFIYSIFRMPIKNIYIKGSNLLSDNDIIKVAEIQDYPSIFEVLKNNTTAKIKSIPLVKDAKIRINIFGKFTITIDEYKILFWDNNKQKLIVEEGVELDDSNNYLGVPTLINEVPENIYKKLTKALLKVDNEVLSLISEIEYSPSINNDQVVDNNRFILKMNDGNIVYANLLNIKNLNHYIEIYSTLDNQKGYLYLDSSNEENFYFKRFE